LSKKSTQSNELDPPPLRTKPFAEPSELGSGRKSTPTLLTDAEMVLINSTPSRRKPRPQIGEGPERGHSGEGSATAIDLSDLDAEPYVRNPSRREEPAAASPASGPRSAVAGSIGADVDAAIEAVILERPSGQVFMRRMLSFPRTFRWASPFACSRPCCGSNRVVYSALLILLHPREAPPLPPPASRTPGRPSPACGRSLA
jgi:hypothetical protein